MKCTISLHEIEINSHLDIFFEQETDLETYEMSSELFQAFLSQEKIEIIQKKNIGKFI
jgi:hypothetical protein